MLEEAQRRGVSVVIRQHPEKRGWGEAVFLPGLLRRRRKEKRLSDEDDSGAVE